MRKRSAPSTWRDHFYKLVRGEKLQQSRQVELTYIHAAYEIAGLHPSKIPIHAKSELPFVAWNWFVDLPDGLTDSGWTEESTWEASNVSLQTVLSVCVGAHEVKVFLFRILESIAKLS